MKGTLWILPNLLGEKDIDFLPKKLFEIVPNLDGLIAESPKGARKFLSNFVQQETLRNFPIYLLNEHTQANDYKEFLDPLKSGQSLGFISDAGMPCIADPGSDLVFLARQQGIDIQVILASCSIMMALILSGFDANSFCFHGYLPRKEDQLEKALQKLEKQSSLDQITQIWIEAPYRSAKMLEACCKCLRPSTYLCLAKNLRTSFEEVTTLSIQDWKKKEIRLTKEPAIFLLSSKKMGLNLFDS